MQISLAIAGPNPSQAADAHGNSRYNIGGGFATQTPAAFVQNARAQINNCQHGRKGWNNTERCCLSCLALVAWPSPNSLARMVAQRELEQLKASVTYVMTEAHTSSMAT